MADREPEAHALSVIGRSLPKVDAAAKVTGQTVFADDLVLPRMAYARLLRSPHPHARVLRVDVSKAAALPGVLATLVGSELPIPFGILPVSQDEHALALDKVRFVGDPVAAVAALDEETAEAACKNVAPGGGPPDQAELKQEYQKLLKFSACMRSHGVQNFPDPKLDKDGVGIEGDVNRDSPQYKTATQACRSLAPRGF